MLTSVFHPDIGKVVANVLITYHSKWCGEQKIGEYFLPNDLSFPDPDGKTKIIKAVGTKSLYDYL